MLDGIIDHLIHGVLVDDALAVVQVDHRPAHAAEAQEGHLVPVHGIHPVNHLPGAFLGLGGLLFRGATRGGRAQGQRPGARYLDKVSAFHG